MNEHAAALVIVVSKVSLYQTVDVYDMTFAKKKKETNLTFPGPMGQRPGELYAVRLQIQSPDPVLRCNPEIASVKNFN